MIHCKSQDAYDKAQITQSESGLLCGTEYYQGAEVIAPKKNQKNKAKGFWSFGVCSAGLPWMPKFFTENCFRFKILRQVNTTIMQLCTQ